MKAQQGKFVVFFDVLEFDAWLDSTPFNKVIRLLQCQHTDIPSYTDFQQTNISSFSAQMESVHLQRGFSEISAMTSSSS